MLTALQNNQASSALCTTFVTPLPCGIGPGNGNSGRFQFMYGTVQSLIGDTAITLTGYVNDNKQFTNDVNRYTLACPGQIVGQPANCPFASEVPTLSPLSSTSGTLARGLAASATLTRDKHTFTLSGSTFAGITTFTPLQGGLGFVQPSTFATASRQVQFADQYKVNDKLTLGPNVSYAGTSGAGSSLLFGFSANWRPVSSDTYNASISFGSSQPANGLVRSLSDPQSARVNCYANTAIVSGPGDLPSHQSAASYDVGWTHQWAHGQFSLSAYRQTQGGQLVNAQVTGDSLGLTDPSNPFYQAVTGYFNNVCGAPGGTVLQPLLYALACERLLSEPVEAGRLYYCTADGGYEERVVPLDAEGRRVAGEVVDIIGRALADGFLPAMPAKGACRYCDYRPVCGPHEETRTARKPKDRCADLERLRRLP